VAGILAPRPPPDPSRPLQLGPRHPPDPQRPLSEWREEGKKIGPNYSLVNLRAFWLGGVSACHGRGGLCGCFTFGARRGGSVVLCGTFHLLTGPFLPAPLGEVGKIFPQPSRR
jgi:hypothetical protein